jgi:hypothetical protein
MADATKNETDKANTTTSGFGPKGSEADKHLPENSHENLDEKLDKAVDETFPGSDPVSVKITK